MSRTEELKITVSVDDQGGVRIADLSGKFKTLDSEIKRTAIALEDLSGGLQLTTIVTGANQAIGLFGQLSAAIQGVWTQLEAGAKELEAEAAFSGMLKDADAMLDRLRSATSGMIADTELQTLAARWRASGEEIEHLLAALPGAYRVAAATGLDYLSVAERLAKARATGRVLSIQEFSGIVDTTKAHADLAAKLGTLPGLLSATQKKAAEFEQAMRQLNERFGEVKFDEAAQRVQRLAVEVTNAKGAMQALATETVFGAAKGSEAFAQAAQGEVYAKYRKEIDATRQQQREAAEELRQFVAPAFRAVHDLLGEMIAAEKERIESAGRAAERTQAVAGALKTMATATYEAVKATLDLGKAELARRKAAEEEVNDAEKYIKLLTDKAAIEARATSEQTILERLKLGVINDQLTALEAVANLARRSMVQNWLRDWQEGIRRVAGTSADEWRKMLAEVSRPVSVARGGGRGGDRPPTLEEQERKLYSPQEMMALERRTEETLAKMREARAKEEAERLDAISVAVAKLNETYAEEARYLEELQLDYALLTGQITEHERARLSLATEEILGPMAAEIRAVREATLAWSEKNAVLRETGNTIAKVGDSFSQAMGTLSGLAAMQGQDDPFTQRAAHTAAQLSKIGAAFGDMVANAQGGMKAMAPAIGGAISALGGMAAGFADSIGEAALIMGMFEAVNAGTQAALGMIPAAIAHGANAVAYFGLAAYLGLRGGGRGQTASSGMAAHSLGTATPSAMSAGTVNYTIYMGSGNVYADDGPSVGEKIIDHLAAAAFGGKKIPKAVMG